MNQTLSPQELLIEGQTMYRAGDYQSAAQAFAAAENSFNLIKDEASAAEMANNRSVALSHGVVGTPTFFVIGPDSQVEKIVGAQPPMIFEAVIKEMSWIIFYWKAWACL